MYMGTRGMLEIALAMRNDKSITLTAEQLAKIEATIHEELLGIRNYNREKERCKKNHPDWHYTDYDRRYCKEVLDHELTEDEWAEYQYDNWQHWYNPYDDGRDCTGVWFHTRMKRFILPGKTIIYHFQGCDV